MDAQDGAKSFWEWWKERTSSPLYFTYLVSLIAWNWKIIYVLFSSPEGVTFQDKFFYIQNDILLFDGHLSAVEIFLIPFLWALVLIKFLPYPDAFAHKISTDAHFERLKYYKTAERDAIQEIGELTQESLKIAATTRKREEEIERLRSNPERWARDYNEFIKNPRRLNHLEKIFHSVLLKSGRLQDVEGRQFVGPEEMGSALAFDIIRKTGSRIDLNEKGQYFLRRFLESGGKFDLEHK